MEEYDLLLTEYEIKLFQNGLDEKDYWNINRYIKNISFEYERKKAFFEELVERNGALSDNNIKLTKELFLLKQYISYLDDLLMRYRILKKMISKSIFIKPQDFILSEVCLTHLVYTNNKNDWIKLYADDSFQFICHFHKEKSPSMGVTNYKGLFNCYGCGCGGNAIHYICAYENLMPKEAMELLARIYLIDLPNNSVKEDDPTVIRYRETLISDDFYDLLKKGYNRTSKRDLTNRVKLALEKYEKHFETIERVKKDKHIYYSKKNPKCKKINAQSLF